MHVSSHHRLKKLCCEPTLDTYNTLNKWYQPLVWTKWASRVETATTDVFFHQCSNMVPQNVVDLGLVMHPDAYKVQTWSAKRVHKTIQKHSTIQIRTSHFTIKQPSTKPFSGQFFPDILPISSNLTYRGWLRNPAPPWMVETPKKIMGCLPPINYGFV